MDDNEIVDIPEKCVIVKINRAHHTEPNLYECARKAWSEKEVPLQKADKADYVLAVYYGIVKAVFSNLKWYPSQEYPGRIEFTGVEVISEIATKYVGKRIPEKYRRFGNAHGAQTTY